MGTKGFGYAGLLPGTGKPVRSSARCIIYDHKREVVYLSTDNVQLARDVAYAQRLRDPKGDYAAYELTGSSWCEIRITISKPPERHNTPPPLFLFWLWSSFAIANVFSFLL
jgi:hypothetical protein